MLINMQCEQCLLSRAHIIANMLWLLAGETPTNLILVW